MTASTYQTLSAYTACTTMTAASYDELATLERYKKYTLIIYGT
jgi:hypothetical protein